MNLVGRGTRNKLPRNSTEPSILARGKMYIMVVPVLNKHPDLHHQSTILHSTSSTSIDHRSCMRELHRWKFVRIPRGSDKGSFDNIRYHDVACDTMLLLIRVARSQLFIISFLLWEYINTNVQNEV
jgi:hypothetical protein